MIFFLIKKNNMNLLIKQTKTTSLSVCLKAHAVTRSTIELKTSRQNKAETLLILAKDQLFNVSK